MGHGVSALVETAKMMVPQIQLKGGKPETTISGLPVVQLRCQARHNQSNALYVRVKNPSSSLENGLDVAFADPPLQDIKGVLKQYSKRDQKGQQLVKSAKSASKPFSGSNALSPITDHKCSGSGVQQFSRGAENGM